MRVVAKFQFTTPSEGDEVVQRIDYVIKRWMSRKFDFDSSGGAVIRRSGLGAEVDKRSDVLDGRRRDTLTVLEPIDGGTLQTDVHVLATVDRTVLRCVLSIGSDGGISPANVPLRAPTFIREVIALPVPWTIGISGERVFAQNFSAEADNVPELEDLIFSPVRRLPVVVVSELSGETLAGDLHERLSQDLCGLAHTVRLSQEGARELTSRRGREWSCYNGAVRLYWPDRSHRNDSRVHPLWTYDYIMSRSEIGTQARDLFRGLIAGRIIEASTFVADDGAFNEFEVAKIRQTVDAARAEVEHDGDIQALADSYAKENDSLRAKVDEQSKDIDILRENIEALTIALRSIEESVPVAVEQAPPQTIEEAVAIARRELDGRVVIARETEIDVADLNPSAGPPDKVLRYLLTLGELANALSMDTVGQAIPIWLRERNVECSVESETGKNNRENRQFRRRIINGEEVDCEFHAKPADGVSPDRCVRIYFAISRSEPYVKVGYIGRHIV